MLAHPAIASNNGQARTLPPKVPKTMTTLSHVDDSAEGKKSLGGSGHGVEFQAPEKARWVEAVQIFGGFGFMRGYLVERLYRDNRVLSIGGGTTEIMNEIISKLLL